MLAVGAETIVLISYVVAMRDGTVNEIETRFSRAVHRALAVGIASIILSGAAITAVHSVLGEGVVFAPVFLFKWLLVAVLAGAYLLQRRKPFSHFVAEGLVGGTWYALFLVHILAPDITWVNFATLYAVFMVGFVAVWSAIVVLSRDRSKQVAAPAAPAASAPAPQVKVAPPQPPSPPRPTPTAPAPPPVARPAPVVAPKPVIPPAPKPIPAAPVPPAPPPPPSAPVPDERYSHWLPAIHVMPKTPAQLEDKSHITPAAAVKKTA